jgi:hypothetical protein
MRSGCNFDLWCDLNQVPFRTPQIEFLVVLIFHPAICGDYHRISTVNGELWSWGDIAFSFGVCFQVQLPYSLL